MKQLWKTLHSVLGVDPNDNMCTHNAAFLTLAEGLLPKLTNCWPQLRTRCVVRPSNNVGGHGHVSVRRFIVQ